LTDRSPPSRFVPAAITGFFSMPGSRPWLVLSCLFVASTLEGFGFATLLPVLAIAANQQGEPSALHKMVLEAVEALGLGSDFSSLLAIVAVIMVAKAGLMILVYRIIATTASGVTAELRRNLVANLLRARWLYFVRQPSGRFANAMGVEARRCADGYMVSANFLVFGIQSVIYLVVAFLVSWKIAALAAAVGAFVSALLYGFIRRSRQADRKRARRTQDMTVLLGDTLANIKPIKAMGRTDTFLGYIDSRIQLVRKAIRRQLADREALSSLQEMLLVIFLALGFYFARGFWQVPVAELVVSGLLLARTVSSLNKVQKAHQRAVQYEASFEHVRDIIAETAAMAEPVAGNPPPPLTHGLTFEKVGFVYDDVPVFTDLDLFLPARRITVVTGPSGAGKTTLVDLLLGFLEPQTGRILVDDIPLGEIDRQAWRRLIGYAPQDLTLLHATVRENLTLGDPEISDADIARALELASASEFVARLPHGLETQIGEKGLRLSGGQRQRISLARALAARPRLLILDEVTSALDAETERRICRNLGALRGEELTIIAITHRPVWLELADRLVEMEVGRVQARPPAMHG